MAKNFNETLKENIDLIKVYVTQVETLKEICTILGYCDNGRNTGALSRFLTANNISFSHFRNGASKALIIECVCPQCGTIFSKNSTNAKENKKVTCSYNCSNKYFAKKQQFARHLGEGFNVIDYRLILKKYLKSIDLPEECIVCKENLVLDCHHIDEDRSNNDITNLVFLCPTHHTALHRLNSDIVYEKIAEHLDYRESLLNN